MNRVRALLRLARRANWLTAERARGYAILLAAASLLSAASAAAVFLLPAISGPPYRPLPADFDAFWSGARLALAGHPAMAYDPAALRAAELVAALPAPGGGYWPYLYPPVFLLLSLPLGALPYLPAMAGFALAGWAGFVACLRRLLPAPWPILPVALFPSALINLAIGQNGLVSATCFAAAALLLERAPALAGGVLGLLAFKPHLALCVPVALAAAGRWRAFAACAIAVAALVLLSWAVLGSAAWAAFLAAAPMLRQVLQDPNVWHTGASLYAAVRVLHGSADLAWAAQTAAALAAIACVARVAARRPGAGPEIATLACAALLATPYVMDYDLVCLAVPMAWLARSATRDGWRDWEKLLLGGLYVYMVPLVGRSLNLRAGLPLAPLLLAALLALVVARSLKSSAAARQQPSPAPLAALP
jgi:hypothetical protein